MMFFRIFLLSCCLYENITSMFPLIIKCKPRGCVPWYKLLYISIGKDKIVPHIYMYRLRIAGRLVHSRFSSSGKYICPE